MSRWKPGTATFVSTPTISEPTTLWYHDHTLGMTRLNVYAGLAGFYLIRGGPDDKVLDSRTGTKASLPGPAPRLGDRGKERYCEIPIAIQDRAFDANGSLFYPDTRAFFDEFARSVHPRDRRLADLEPGVLRQRDGGQRAARGRVLDVERRRYRFRLLNGCDSRFLILSTFDDPTGVEGSGRSAPRAGSCRARI